MILFHCLSLISGLFMYLFYLVVSLHAISGFKTDSKVPDIVIAPAKGLFNLNN